MGGFYFKIIPGGNILGDRAQTTEGIIIEIGVFRIRLEKRRVAKGELLVSFG
jgi:hypothetical protein